VEKAAVAGVAQEATKREKGEGWGGNGETQWKYFSRQHDGGYTE
jgi:hypothetical protein